MIPMAHITQWRQLAPWPNDLQVEQDLILSRIIVDIFSNPLLKDELAFRGGTALHKLFFKPAQRYSEDIDLVRVNRGKITDIVDAVRSQLDVWLGEPKTSRNHSSFKFLYRFVPETSKSVMLRVKIEINTRENFSVVDRISKKFLVNSAWFSGEANVNTYQFEELLATKLRALYQRKKGRDLFDLWLALKQEDLDVDKLVRIFLHYMHREGKIISREIFEKNIALKLQEQVFVNDINLLITSELRQSQSKSMVTESGHFMTTENGGNMRPEGWDLFEAAKDVKQKILALLP